jgi:Protein of unknown function (DUF2752)
VTDAHAHPYVVTPAEPETDRVTRFSDRLVARTPRWLAPVAVLGCIGASLGYTMWATPTENGADAIPSCLVKLTTGLDCPGCGGTRAAWYLMHGDLPAAARHHALFVFAVPFLLYLYVAWGLKSAFGMRIPQLRLSPKVLGWFLGAWALFTIVRNLPWAPFTYFFV